MHILAHRGWWLKPREKNTLAALWRALDAGFGIETDLRDRDGQLVIAHDPSSAAAPPFSTFLAGRSTRCGNDDAPLLALNIKADGLAPLISTALSSRPSTVAYVFDMSVPETAHYLAGRVPVFVRQSEQEPHPPFYECADGVWLDAFESDWYDMRLVEGHLAAGKDVAIVSPELHNRDPLSLWTNIRQFLQGAGDLQSHLQLCTDRPRQAQEFLLD